MDNREQIRQDIKGVRDDLALALRELRSEAGQKLNRKDLEEVEKELAEIDELFRHLQTGLVWVTLLISLCIPCLYIFKNLRVIVA
jgi:hypothetical protein